MLKQDEIKTKIIQATVYKNIFISNDCFTEKFHPEKR